MSSEIVKSILLRYLEVSKDKDGPDIQRLSTCALLMDVDEPRLHCLADPVDEGLIEQLASNASPLEVSAILFSFGSLLSTNLFHRLFELAYLGIDSKTTCHWLGWACVVRFRHEPKAFMLPAELTESLMASRDTDSRITGLKLLFATSAPKALPTAVSALTGRAEDERLNALFLLSEYLRERYNRAEEGKSPLGPNLAQATTNKLADLAVSILLTGTNDERINALALLGQLFRQDMLSDEWLNKVIPDIVSDVTVRFANASADEQRNTVYTLRHFFERAIEKNMRLNIPSTLMSTLKNGLSSVVQECDDENSRYLLTLISKWQAKGE